MQSRVVEELFAMYFENEGDITSHDALTKAAVRAGLAEKMVKDWLASDGGGEQVDKEIMNATRGISGVPHVTIQGKYQIGGAEDPSRFLQIFEKIRAEQVRPDGS
ncbi:hypothetical protein FQN57_007324 [Myotisia sp. PD_48]|nr:hypothetical protein FQN57_007324 [Myotisia sp. PD_48]